MKYKLHFIDILILLIHPLKASDIPIAIKQPTSRPSAITRLIYVPICL